MSSTDLIFHILDIQSRDQRVESETEHERAVVYESTDAESDEEGGRRRMGKKAAPQAKREMLIHLFGSTADGKPVRVDVTGFRPSFYIRLPDTAVAAAIDSIKTYIERSKVLVGELTFARVNRRKFYGFTANRAFNFVEITCPSLATFRNLKGLFLNEFQEPATRTALLPPLRNATLEVYEANIDPMLRFLHVQNLQPCGWARIAEGLDSAEEDETGNLTLEVSYEDVLPTAGPKPTAPFLVASWDIECYSATGDFPQAKPTPKNPKGDPVIQIGVTLVGGTGEPTKHLFAFPSCDPIAGATVHASATEKEMLADFFNWMAETNPDILIGYNVFGFDERYVWDRAEELGLTGPSSPIHGLTRLQGIGSAVKCEEKRLSSSALGDNFLYIWSTHGRLQIDLYHYIKRLANLPSYKLDEVTKTYMSGKLKAYRREGEALILTLSGAIKDIRPGRAICILDATGESITDKLVISEVAGDTVKICADLEEETFAALEDAAKWVVVKDDVGPQDIFRLHRGSAADRATIGAYCIQDCDLVLELYKKLEVFNNAMSMANVCSVPVSYIFVRGQGIKIESLIFKACRERGTLIPVLPQPRGGGPEDSYEGAIVFDPVPGFYHKSPIGVADFASLYPSTIESENISHDSLVWAKDFTYEGDLIGVAYGDDTYDVGAVPGYAYTDIEFDLWRPDPEDKRKHPEKKKAGLRICRFAQPLDGSKATLPEIIRQLLAARKAKRKEAEKETNPERAALLDAEQLAYKLTANSLYGQLGSSTFKIRLQHLAASVTAYGRKQIMFAKTVIDRFYGPEADDPRCVSNIMYGDTDSLFIEFDVTKLDTKGPPLTPRDRRQAVIDLTAEAGKLVTKALAPPHDFEFDKVFDPMIMFSKKRYAGNMYENNADDYVHKYMGIALKRRDNAPIVKTIFGGAMKKLLNDKDIAGAAAFVRDSCIDLVDGKVSLGQLTITKSLRADYADPSRIAHKALADRMGARDPGNAPAAGDRIGYIYIKPAPGQEASKLQGDRIEHPAYVREHGLKPDYQFYVEHQIQNPVAQMFGLLLEEMPGFDKRRLAVAPDCAERRLTWCENEASQLLFGPCLQRCASAAKAAFVGTFFPGHGGAAHGSSAAKSTLRIVAKTAQAPTKGVITKAPRIDTYIMDQFIISTMKKNEAAVKRAAKKTVGAAAAGGAGKE